MNYVTARRFYWDYYDLALKHAMAPGGLLEVHLNDVPVQMELDTGATVSIITNATYKHIQRKSFVSALQPADSKLRAYTGHYVQVLGLTSVKVRMISCGSWEWPQPAG
jgi:hypothetical protein